MPDILVASGVRKIYRSSADEVEALRSVDFRVEEGEWVSVMGPSGSGKTTLLNCLSGLDDIDGGTVSLDGTDLHSMSDAERTKHRAAAMGFIFQAYNLIPVFTAVENVELPLLLAGVAADEAPPTRRGHARTRPRSAGASSTDPRSCQVVSSSGSPWRARRSWGGRAWCGPTSRRARSTPRPRRS